MSDMVNDSSLVEGEQVSAFDIESQKGMMVLLSAIRASELTAQQKNELRDLAFLYANGGRDQSVRIMLEQKVLATGLQAPTPIAPPEPEIIVAKAPFGTSRPAPVFSYTPASVTRNATPQSATVDPVISTKPEVVPSIQTKTTSEPVQSVPPASVTTLPTEDQDPKIASVPKLETVVVPNPTIDPVAVATPTPEVMVAPEVVASVMEPTIEETVQPAPVAYDSERAMRRIREIKSLVNDQVGNPVNLVDINNEVGREYMAALLDAMKKITSGNSAISAMRRLEESFKVVQETLTAQKNNPLVEKKTETEKLVPQVQKVVPPVPAKPEAVAFAHKVETLETATVPNQQSTSTIPTPTLSPNDTEPIVADGDDDALNLNQREKIVPPQQKILTPITQSVTAPESQGKSELPLEPKIPTPVIPVVAPVINHSFEQPSVPLAPVSESDQKIEGEYSQIKKAVAVPAGKPAPIPMSKSVGEVESAWGPATDTLRPSIKFEQVTSLDKESEQLQTFDNLTIASEVATSANTGDTLFTKEVEDGMQQLLAEWSLFKKSGLFGTGPKGREHPLFKKIAGLQIPLLLAGRFEGATQEIKQSITDYMNGWRYEQGIIYEPGETFEHYLRRVIRHIIDLQKKHRHS